MKQIFKMTALLVLFILTSMIYVIGIQNNMQHQIDDIKSSLDSMRNELETHKEIDVDYYAELNDIYKKINDLYEMSDTKSAEISDAQYESTKNDSSYKNTEMSLNNDETYEDLYDSYYGRLYIPDLNINVALYYGHQQYITDRADSANIFSFGTDYGYTIADHNNQEFSKLFGVQVGMKGYIENKYTGRIDIECVDVFDGYNEGRYIVDESGVSAMNREDYMMYTCRNSFNGVFICLWDIVRYEDNYDFQW